MKKILRRIVFFSVASLSVVALPLVPRLGHAALLDQVNQAFREVHGRNPTVAEWTYWAGRVVRGEKTTYAALVGAIAYQNAHQSGVSTTVAPAVGLASGFEIGRHLYASPADPNALPDGTLIRSASSGAVFYVQAGKKSWVLPGVLNKWLGENHFFKHNIVITLPEADLARYPQRASVNPLYIGKVLVHPTGAQFFIDDKLRKRPLLASVRAALKIPGGNLYPTSDVHLREFPTGPTLTADRYPGGMVVYTGAYHGGQIWKFKEAPDGSIRKHLYLSDYLYEADGNPDESHRALAVPTLFDRHGRGSNIERYPDGWVVGIDHNLYVVQAGALRLISSPQLFDAMGYHAGHIRREHQEFLARYPHGHPIQAYKTIVTRGGAATRGGVLEAPNTASHLLRVRPEIRALINEVNNLYISTHGRDVTAEENRFWVDYIYNGEVNNRADLIAAMQRTALTGKKPALTPRTTPISLDLLRSHWFPYLFYFTHQREPEAADRDYWFSRIQSGDRDTIEKLGGTIQWLKDTHGTSRR